MKLLLREVRSLISGALFGLAFVPAILWYIYFKFNTYLIVYNEVTIEMFYRNIFTRLDEPLVWFWLLVPYLLLRLTRLLFRSIAPRPRVTPPLPQAAARGSKDMIRALLTQGGDINARNSHGQTLLHLAANQGNSDVVRLLLEQGALVDVVENISGYTPLHCAAGHGNADLCELLIRYGADPDALTGKLDSALHLAIQKRRPGVVGVLLKYRARLDIRNKDGMTPLQLAEHLENREIVTLINQHLSVAWPYLQLSRG